jgi:hypothetical protein
MIFALQRREQVGKAMVFVFVAALFCTFAYLELNSPREKQNAFGTVFFAVLSGYWVYASGWSPKARKYFDDAPSDD